MRKIIEVRYHDIDGINNYIEKNKIQESDIVSLTYIPRVDTHFSSCDSKVVLYHYKIENKSLKEF